MSNPMAEESDAGLKFLFSEALRASQTGRVSEAADMLDELAARAPGHPDVYWNLGTFRAQLQQHDRALSAWDAYRAVEPGDWRGRAKVIQACQALGDTARRDEERAALLALRQAGTDPALAGEPRYCIEQFRMGEQVVMAFEIFEPAGERRVFYEFLVGDPQGAIAARYSLGSYDTTTGISRELGRIGQEERIYHLDRYDPRGHTTYGFFSRLLSYDETRAHVVSAMTDALPAVSGITTSPETGRADIYLSEQATAPTELRIAHELGVAAAGGDSPPPPPAPPPSPAPPDATRVSTSDRASRAGRGGGPLSSLSSWAARLWGRRDDRAN